MKTNTKNVAKSNNVAKKIAEYFFWTITALLLGIGYMRLLLGADPEVTNLLSFIFSMIRLWGIFYVGLVIGAIAAGLFILLDIFYLKKKCQSLKHRLIMRVFTMLFIFTVVSTLHYLLEKPLDVI